MNVEDTKQVIAKLIQSKHYKDLDEAIRLAKGDSTLFQFMIQKMSNNQSANQAADLVKE